MSSVIQDGTFLQPIQIGTQNIQLWTDWTAAGITTQNPAPTGIPGDYASIPVGGDLFQDFSALAPGNYTLTFYVENQSAWNAKLVLAVQQYLGTPISELFAAGTAEELSLPAAMKGFVKETLNFTITPSEAFIPQELTFSNSYDAPILPITDSVNPAGTIIDIADVSLNPTPFSWARGVSGDFANASNWSPAEIPGPANDVTIGAKGTYTVTSSADETVDSLAITNKNVTLLISGASNYSTFTMTSGGINNGKIELGNLAVLNEGTPSGTATFTNTGAIDLTTDSSVFFVEGNVLLQGNGHLSLDDGHITNDSPASPVVLPATLSTDNVISGSGGIGSGIAGATFTVINEAAGVIDATGVDPLTVSAFDVVENAGILESTNPNKLASVGGLALSQNVTIDNQGGIIEAHGPNTHVDLHNGTTIVGGTLETSGTNAVIQTNGESFLDGSKSNNPVNLAGHVLVVDNSNLELIGTINNTGEITVASANPNNGGDETGLIISGHVTLEGGGHVTLTNSSSNFIGADSSLPAYQSQLINVDNVISGAGDIGVAVVNQANGIIDANDSTPLIFGSAYGMTNDGLMEATHTGTLIISSVYFGLDNTHGTIGAGQGSTVALENSSTITGGLVTVMKGAIFEAEGFGPDKVTGASVTNAGTVGAESGNLTIIGNVTNTGTLDANNATLVVDGSVSGGKATIEGTGEIEFGGASSANVTFGASTDAILKLDSPSTFTGTVSGLTTGDYIDFANINFADNPTVSYSSKTHVLTVTDSVSHVADTVTLKGTVGSFSAQSDGNGGTLVTDPPPSTNIAAVTQNSFVFAPNLGENAGNATNHVQNNEPIDFSHHGGELADLAALMVQAHAEGAHLLVTPDAVDGHHAAALTGHHSLV